MFKYERSYDDGKHRKNSEAEGYDSCGVCGSSSLDRVDHSSVVCCCGKRSGFCNIRFHVGDHHKDGGVVASWHVSCVVEGSVGLLTLLEEPWLVSIQGLHLVPAIGVVQKEIRRLFFPRTSVIGKDNVKVITSDGNLGITAESPEEVDTASAVLYDACVERIVLNRIGEVP